MSFQLLNKEFEVNLNELDDSQLNAVSSAHDQVVVRASAGSGKTKLLIAAIAKYRYEHLNDRICAITYTRAARAEMEMRLREMGIYDVEVTTIHVWSRNMLDYFANKYDFRIRILEEGEIKSILQDIVRQYLVKSRVRSVNIGVLYGYITGNKNMDITENYRRTLNALEERYIKYKRNNMLYDFTDYPQYLWDVLETYNEDINNIDALFVDEFQDVDSVQFDIFNRVNANKKLFIGDPWQSIYIFRNADGEVFNKLRNFEVFKLKYNYRSYQEIINFATTMYESLYNAVVNDATCYITEVDNSVESSIICHKGYGGSVYVINPYGECSTYEDDQSRLTYSYHDTLKHMLEKRPMFLCRTNKEVKALQDDYGIINASTVHQAKGLEYDDVVVVDHTINCVEDLNIAYVALTRARNSLLVINWSQLENFLKYKQKAF